jgi:hypothetical protein
MERCEREKQEEEFQPEAHVLIRPARLDAPADSVLVLDEAGMM